MKNQLKFFTGLGWVVLLSMLFWSVGSIVLYKACDREEKKEKEKPIIFDKGSSVQVLSSMDKRTLWILKGAFTPYAINLAVKPPSQLGTQKRYCPHHTMP